MSCTIILYENPPKKILRRISGHRVSLFFLFLAAVGGFLVGEQLGLWWVDHRDAVQLSLLDLENLMLTILTPILTILRQR